MTLTKQSSTPMVVFENDNNGTNMISVELTAKNKHVQRPNILARLSKKLTNLSNSTAPIENLPSMSSSSIPATSTFERQNSSDSDLSLSKLDLNDEHYVVIEKNLLNLPPRTSEVNVGRRESSILNNKKFAESFQNFYSCFLPKRSKSDSNIHLTQPISTSNRKSLIAFSCCLNCFSTHSGISIRCHSV